jgi:cohesin loading factor subunit SCC2
MVEDFCGRVEIPDDADGDEWLSIPLNDAKVLVNEITFVRSKKILHEIPMDTLTRLLHVIDRQIRCSQGLSIDVKENVSVVVAKFYLLQNCIWFSFFCSDLEIGSIQDAALIV